MRINKIIVTFLITIIFCSKTTSQEGLPIYSDYLSDNFYLLFPSMAGVSNCTKLRFTGRKQWMDQDKSPNLQTLSINGRLGESRSALGSIIFNDENGYHSQSGAYFTYAHHILFSRSELDLNMLSFGLSAGLIQYKLDESSFLNAGFDPLISGTLETTGYFNIDVGMSYVNSKYYAHLTLKNLLFSPHDMYGDFEYDYPRDRTSYKRLIASLGYVFYTDSPWSFEPSTLFQISELTTEKSIDLNLKSYYKLNFGRIWAGLSFRNSFEGAEYINVSNGTVEEQRLQLITPLFGIDYKDFVFSYNYSHQFGDINFGSGGFHQITIGFNFLRGSIDCDCY